MKKAFLVILVLPILIVALLNGMFFVSVSAVENPDWTFGNTRAPNGVSGNTVIRYLGTDTEVEIPQVDGGWNVLIVGQGAFSEADSVKKVIVGDNVKVINYAAFAGCESLEEVVLPKSITVVSAAFSGCVNLKKINFPYEQGIIDNSTFKNTGLTSFVVSTSVNEIGYKAFAGCTQLTDIWIMDFVSSIAPDAFEGVTARVHYSPSRWKEENLKNYGGNLTWVAEQEYSYAHDNQNPVQYVIGGGQDLVLTLNAPAEKIAHIKGNNLSPFLIPFHIELTSEQCQIIPVSATETKLVVKASYLDVLGENRVSVGVYFTEGYELYASIERISAPVTEPPTEPATEPPTEPATEPPTEPVTQPSAPATELSGESVTEPSISLQQAKPPEKPRADINTVLQWIFIGLPALIVIGAVVAMRIWRSRVRLKYLSEKFGDRDEED